MVDRILMTDSGKGSKAVERLLGCFGREPSSYSGEMAPQLDDFGLVSQRGKSNSAIAAPKSPRDSILDLSCCGSAMLHNCVVFSGS